jgi:hypothetical protein
MTQVVVDRNALAGLIREMYGLRIAYTVEGGAVEQWVDGEPVIYLDPRDELVTLAVQAGVLIPGPLKPGTVPPAPPQHKWVGHPNIGTIVGSVYRVTRGCVASRTARWCTPAWRLRSA